MRFVGLFYSKNMFFYFLLYFRMLSTVTALMKLFCFIRALLITSCSSAFFLFCTVIIKERIQITYMETANAHKACVHFVVQKCLSSQFEKNVDV